MKNTLPLIALLIFMSSCTSITIGTITDNTLNSPSSVISSNEISNSKDPLISSWILRNNSKGYNNLPANVESISVSGTNLVVKSNGIPSYEVGKPNGWPGGNPSTPGAQDYQFKIPQTPVEETGTKTATGLGPIGVLTNGVPIFNALDAMSYLNKGVWNRNAHYWEIDGMDNCNGHPAPGLDKTKGQYHHHFFPVCLMNTHYAQYDDKKHSPIVGWAFDGFPVYGIYGYPDKEGLKALKIMTSSYKERNITDRKVLADGTKLSEDKYGPSVNTEYPLGAFIEDYEYIKDSGDLDQHNGHFTVTPEYPNGIYHYHVTVNTTKTDGVYPFFIGPKYYGKVEKSNINTGGGMMGGMPPAGAKPGMIPPPPNH